MTKMNPSMVVVNPVTKTIFHLLNMFTASIELPWALCHVLFLKKDVSTIQA
jgi:hypothetical protein